MGRVGATWKNLNPGWEYRYVDHEQRESKVKEYPKIYEIYKTQSPVHQADLWRCIVTYEYGGCYADMDSVCRIPIDFLLKTIRGNPEIITVPEVKGWGNSHNYIAKEKSKIMAKVLDKITSVPPIDVSDIPWHSWRMFVTTVYSEKNVSKLFSAGIHSKDYKDRFLVENHRINYYGKSMSYLDFLQQNNLSPDL
jgi:mannosyltransferase OCH1-like enzyme